MSQAYIEDEDEDEEVAEVVEAKNLRSGKKRAALEDEEEEEVPESSVCALYLVLYGFEV